MIDLVLLTHDGGEVVHRRVSGLAIADVDNIRPKVIVWNGRYFELGQTNGGDDRLLYFETTDDLASGDRFILR